jgi:sulfur relay (sulfurtransferase) complex TusBCD TusD component (DsrE family)
MDARGLSETSLVNGVERSNMVELAVLSEEADKILTF